MDHKMYPASLLLCLCLGAFVKCAAGSDWCYTGCEHTPTHWGDLPGSFCAGIHQSPININTSMVQIDPSLDTFTFSKFLSQNVTSITNNGHTVICALGGSNAEVSGGGLNATYSPTQFHFHWGDTEYHPGSEHMIDGQRYPMEMHIVSLKKGLTLEQAMADPQGIAVLGFFINATEDAATSGPWNALTSYLSNITGNVVNVTDAVSINDLIKSVDLTKFYRYMGSLTTPNCTEAVMWTVFHEPVNINKSLIQQFPLKTGFTNVYRPTQNLNSRQVSASPAMAEPASHAWCYDHCVFTTSHWNLLPQSWCGGTSQSPVNIQTQNVTMDNHLGAFTYTNFDNKKAIQYMTNTGHTVQCSLKENVVEVSGGGLGYNYSALQLHFHWGTAQDPGSEHTVDSKRYTMEMHIVSKRKDLSLDAALQTPYGLAVLGFFIEANSTSSSSVTNSWKTLTNHLSAIPNISSVVNVTEELSIDDLLGNINRAAYYRYNGSLTTPSCNEAVVWTVFKDSVKVDPNLIMMFPKQMGYSNVFRPTQALNTRKIYTSTTSASSSPGPIVQLLLLVCIISYNLYL